MSTISRLRAERRERGTPNHSRIVHEHDGNSLIQRKRDGFRRPFADASQCRSKAVVHVELDRVSGHAEARHFGHLQVDVGVDVRSR